MKANTDLHEVECVKLPSKGNAVPVVPFKQPNSQIQLTNFPVSGDSPVQGDGRFARCETVPVEKVTAVTAVVRVTALP